MQGCDFATPPASDGSHGAHTISLLRGPCPQLDSRAGHAAAASSHFDLLTFIEPRCEENTGDGAGILVSIPHAFFADVARAAAIPLPAPDSYGIGMFFLPTDRERRQLAKREFEAAATERGHAVLGWRTVPVNNAGLGLSAKATEPMTEQVRTRRRVEPALTGAQFCFIAWRPTPSSQTRPSRWGCLLGRCSVLFFQLALAAARRSSWAAPSRQPAPKTLRLRCTSSAAPPRCA